MKMFAGADLAYGMFPEQSDAWQSGWVFFEQLMRLESTSRIGFEDFLRAYEVQLQETGSFQKQGLIRGF